MDLFLISSEYKEREREMIKSGVPSNFSILFLMCLSLTVFVVIVLFEQSESTEATLDIRAEYLPLKFITKTIDDLKIGEKGYTISSAMKIDFNRKGWLNPNSVIEENSNGQEVQILVERSDDGYNVILQPRTPYRWTPERIEGDCTKKEIPIFSTTKIKKSTSNR